MIRVGNAQVFRGSIALPRVGVWTADLALDASADVDVGETTISIADGVLLTGTLIEGTLAYGRVQARIVGGAAGLGKMTTPKHYAFTSVGTVLADLMRTAGETMSGAVGPEVTGQHMAAWTTVRQTVGDQIANLVGFALSDEMVWRLLPDGTLWIGADVWPETTHPESIRELAREPRMGRLDLGMDYPTLLPGTTLRDEQIDRVVYRIDHFGVRATAWLAV